ncbi:partner and localizer of BRCA2 isoform X2 [Dermochelys coriacea]|uniref:partner and localizer of BRCA2 isoform X2 n=1 Tax=Dermochelys coriacea TaxID=27794 RepID=UPI001CA9E550|nr:partner and localizer of BRCA2 isoform X2 [Dermochelys coriacea]
MLAMDGAPRGKALSWQEKEKLKEKLAFLKREYSKTFNRLQRAQRAERVKNYVKKTVAEQNQLLRQEETENNTTELMDKQSPNDDDKSGICRLQTNTCSDSGTEKKMSVTFKLEPEFFNNEVNLQESSLAGSTNSDQENILSGLKRSVIEENQSQLPRSRMTLVSEGRESACEVPPISAGETLENQMGSTEEPGSPVFKGRNTISNTKNKIQKAPKLVIVREEKGLTPQDPQVGDFQEMPEENVFLSVPKPLSCMLMGGNNVQQPVSPCAEDICDSYEPLPQCLVGDVPFSLQNIENTGKELACIENQMDREELCRALDLTVDNQPSLAGRSNPSTSESRPHKERNHNMTKSSSRLNTDSLMDNVEEPLRNQEAQTEAGSPVLEKTPPAAESALSSCTMIEGLLFPVEYYVRTTRRMSNCQRKVDLEAVILSQLGRSRKGLRSKHKQINSNSDQLYQETARSDLQAGGTPFPFLGAESDPVSSNSSQKSLPPSDESCTSSGSLSQKTVISMKQAKGKSWRRGKGRWVSACRPALNGSQAHPESSDLTVLKENSHLLSNDSQPEKENCEGDPEKSPIGKTRVLVPAAGEATAAEMTDITRPTEADLPDVSQTFSKCHQPPLEHIQNPLQGNNFLNPWDEAFFSPTRDLEASVNVSQADKQPVEHIRNQCVQKACRAEQLPTVKESLLQHDLPSSSVKRKVRQGSKGKRGRSQQMDFEGPAPLGHFGLDPMAFDPPFHFQNEMLSVKWLPSQLNIKDFHLPDEEFGLLKFEKLQSCTVKQLEPFVPSGSEHWLQSAGDTVALGDIRLKQVNTEGKSLENSFISPSKTMSPKLPYLEGQLHKKGLSPSELLLTPASSVSAGAINQLESQIPTPAFPVLGATPAILSLVHEALPDTLSVLPLQVKTNLFKEPVSHVVDRRECNNSTDTLHSDSCRTGSDCRSDEAVPLKDYQQPGIGSKECCRTENKLTAEGLAVALSDNLRDRSLQLASKLKNPSSSCAVDVSTVWWESAGCTELCIVTACETSISLWKPLASSQWKKVYTWHLTEIPVIQIVPLPDVSNLVCVALGDLEIGEIRLLLCSSEDGSLKQSLVKTGNIKAVLGLTNRRLVSNSGTLQDQQIEIISVSEAGSNERQTLMPLEETILAFAEVEGIRDALVGTTAVNSLVVWNLKTGQILKKMHVGYSYPASICHRAYSDSGLLFVVLSHPHAKENESCGNPAFRMRVFNPKTARSTGVMFFSLPPGYSGRYLEGEVKGVSAAAVLTSGTIAVWDLFLGQCTALLPPNGDGNWSLVRWSVTDSCLLAGQKDGSVYVYHYSQAKAVGK